MSISLFTQSLAQIHPNYFYELRTAESGVSLMPRWAKLLGALTQSLTRCERLCMAPWKQKKTALLAYIVPRHSRWKAKGERSLRPQICGDAASFVFQGKVGKAEGDASWVGSWLALMVRKAGAQAGYSCVWFAYVAKELHHFETRRVHERGLSCDVRLRFNLSSSTKPYARKERYCQPQDCTPMNCTIQLITHNPMHG